MIKCKIDKCEINKSIIIRLLRWINLMNMSCLFSHSKNCKLIDTLQIAHSIPKLTINIGITIPIKTSPLILTNINLNITSRQGLSIKINLK